ncbi:MAG: rRNA maturation RNase YbeY [Candidatus Coatesbacteria bacterium]|nr:rRNA maturation RNase YbeY [Candidatus Coatesbacteria bacterium]
MESLWIGKVINEIVVSEKNMIDLEDSSINIVFASEEQMKSLNLEYRRKNFSTDVLAFKYEDNDFNDEEKISGEIVIAEEYIRRQAKEEGVPYNEELARMIIHGFLHILGYDHKNKKDLKNMTEKTENYLSLTRGYWEDMK